MYYNETTKQVTDKPRDKNISNFWLSDTETLNANGWYEITRPPLNDWENYTSNYKVEWNIAQQEVIEVELEEYKQRKISEVNSKTSETILSKYSQFDQINATARVAEINSYVIWEKRDLTEAELQELIELWQIKSFVDSEREKVKQLKQAIRKATTHEEVYNLTIG